MPTTEIQVESSSGPVRGARVVLGFSFGHSNAALTDSDGVAEIEHQSSGEATIFVNGRDCGSLRAPGRRTVRI